MADNDFAATKCVKQIKIKAVICIMLVFFPVFALFSGATDIDDETADIGTAVEIVRDGENLHFYLRNCEGLTTADLSVNLSSPVACSVAQEAGKDYGGMQNNTTVLSNHVMVAANTKKLSDMKFSVIFADILYSSEVFEEKAPGCGIDGDKFHFITLKLELEDGYTAADVEISAKGTATFGVNEQLDIDVVIIGDEVVAEGTTTAENATHSHEYTSKTTKKAGCTTSGVKTYTCSCGDTYKETLPSFGGHKLTWKTVKKATAFTAGKKEGSCANCDYTEAAVIEKLTKIAVRSACKDEIRLSGKDNILVISGTTVSDMKKAVPENTFVHDPDGNAVSGEALAATGMKLVMNDNNGKVVDTRVIIVPGDVDCDGEVSASDARSTLRKSVGLDALDSSQEAAADIQQDSVIGADDARIVLRTSVGLEDIKVLFKSIA